MKLTLAMKAHDVGSWHVCCEGLSLKLLTVLLSMSVEGSTSLVRGSWTSL